MAAVKKTLPDDIDLEVDLSAARARPGAAAAPRFLAVSAGAAPQTPPIRPIGTVKGSAVSLSVYLSPEDHRRLRLLAASEDASIQSLLLDGLDHVLAGRGEAPVSRWPSRRRKVR